MRTRTDTEQPVGTAWTQLEAFGATESRVDVVVYMDGPRGRGGIGVTVTHGTEENVIFVEATPVMPLADLLDQACARLREVLAVELGGLAPF